MTKTELIKKWQESESVHYDTAYSVSQLERLLSSLCGVTVTGSAPSDPRPALILSEPIPLHDSENGPRWQQEALHLVSGPVQQADDGVVRDYFVAESSGGRRVWLYRTTESGRPGANWHLQGLFA